MQKIFIGLSIIFFISACSQKENAKEYRSLKELKNERVAVLTGSTQDLYMTKNYPDVKLVRVQGAVEMFVSVETGKSEYALADEFFSTMAQKDGVNIEVVDDSVFSNMQGICFRKEDSNLCRRFNTFLADIKKSGVYDEIETRWMKNSSHTNMLEYSIPKTDQKIIVGIQSGSPPFTFVKNGKLTGLEIELIYCFAEREKIGIEFIDMPFSGLIAALSSKKVDIIASSLFITPERSKQVLFSDPYLAQNTVLVERAKTGFNSAFVMPEINPSDINKGATATDTALAIIGKGTISAVEGTTQDLYISSILPHSQFVSVVEYSSAFQMLAAKKVDYVLCNYGIAAWIIMADPNFEIIYNNLLFSDCAYGVNKSNPKILHELNVFIEELRDNGDLEKLQKYWFTELDNGKLPELDFSDYTEILRVGSGCASIPFTFLAEGEARGLDIDILTRFAHHTKRKIEVIQLPFSALIASVETNKVDLISNSLAPTEERKKKINFTASYAVNKSTIIHLKKNTTQVGEKESFLTSLKKSFVSNLVVEKRYLLILDGFLETLKISFFSLILGTILGAFICFLRMHKSFVLSNFAKAYIAAMRGLPILVILMILYYVIFAESSLSASIVAVFAFSLNFSAYVSEMFRSSVESIEQGQTEAGLSMGFTQIQTFVLIVAPQAIARVLPIYKGEAISLVKMTSIVGYIAVQDLTKASDIIRSRTFDAFFPLLFVAAIYFLFAWLLTLLLDYLASKLIKRK